LLSNPVIGHARFKRGKKRAEGNRAQKSVPFGTPGSNPRAKQLPIAVFDASLCAAKVYAATTRPTFLRP
jgi:hypothetical protein